MIDRQTDIQKNILALYHIHITQRKNIKIYKLELYVKLTFIINFLGGDKMAKLAMFF